MRLEMATEKRPIVIFLAPDQWRVKEEPTRAALLTTAKNHALSRRAGSIRPSTQNGLDLYAVKLIWLIAALFLVLRAGQRRRQDRARVAGVVASVAAVVIYTDLAAALVRPIITVTFRGGVA